jgi:2-oxoglutarate ferredoxin oxidoreductase subunit alpha
VFVVEMNDEGFYGYGQLAGMLRARYCDPRIRGINKTDGLTWKVKELLAAVKAKLALNGGAAKTVLNLGGA